MDVASDNRPNFLPNLHNTITGINPNNPGPSYQNNSQMNRYSIEHPQGIPIKTLIFLGKFV